MSRRSERSLWIFLPLILAGTASAHQPRLVDNAPSIEVRNPEVSQAFYARLSGAPQTYIIRSETPLTLYVNLLAPDGPGFEIDYTAVIARKDGPGGEVLAVLDGKIYDWRPFFEPFGGDHYRLGPEYESAVPAGTYTIVVTSPDNEGKYALAIGKVEKFPPGEMARTIVTLPKLKKYFGKSPWTAYFNLSGVFLLVVVGAVAGLAVLFF